MITYKNIEIVPYNPDWPLEFEKEAEKIKAALGDNCIEVHHIGSTSVLGLAAKPIIDILPVVKDINKVDQAILAMQELGYEMGKELFIIPHRKMFAKTSEIRTHNVHIFKQDSAEIDCHLKFRNWLREHPNDRDKYTLLKQNLAEKFPDNMLLYYSGKEDFILNIGAKSGWDKLRIVQAHTLKELETSKALRQKYIFDQAGLKDPYLWTFDSQDHIHFVFYKGIEIIGYAHIQLWPETRAALRIIAIDENYRNNGYGGEFLKLCEKWLKVQGYKSLHIESSPRAYSFYKKYNYVEMPFNDPDHYESDERDIPVGKIL